MGLGTASGLGGVVVLATAEDQDARIVGYSLLGTGCLLGGLSLLPFKMDSEVERIYREFAGMPANTPDHERRFEELAQKKRRERLTRGSTTIIAGLIALILGTDESDYEGPHYSGQLTSKTRR